MPPSWILGKESGSDLCLPKTQHAVVTKGQGGYEQLEYRIDVAVPEIPADGDRYALLRVLAAALNNTDINTRLGWYGKNVKGSTADASKKRKRENGSASGGWSKATPFPFIQGVDCCARCIAVSNSIDTSWIGKRVIVMPCHGKTWLGVDENGCFCQFVRVKIKYIYAVDCSWPDEQLAAFPCAYGTAESMILRAGSAIHAGCTAVVTGASGECLASSFNAKRCAYHRLLRRNETYGIGAFSLRKSKDCIPLFMSGPN